MQRAPTALERVREHAFAIRELDPAARVDEGEQVARLHRCGERACFVRIVRVVWASELGHG